MTRNSNRLRPRCNMKKSTYASAGDTIHRLREQINLEENQGKLRDLVSRLQIALNEERPPMSARITTHPQQEENPFDTVILG